MFINVKHKLHENVNTIELFMYESDNKDVYKFN